MFLGFYHNVGIITCACAEVPKVLKASLVFFSFSLDNFSVFSFYHLIWLEKYIGASYRNFRGDKLLHTDLI